MAAEVQQFPDCRDVARRAAEFVAKDLPKLKIQNLLWVDTTSR